MKLYNTPYQMMLALKDIPPPMMDDIMGKINSNLTIREEILKSALISNSSIAYAMPDYPGWYLFRERRHASGNPT